MDIIQQAKSVFDREIEALIKTRDSLDKNFITVFNCINECSGKVIFTGIGKPGHIGHKVAATFSSLGIPSFYLHPADARHGDLGMVSANDVVIAISLSGESDEVIGLLPNVKFIGAKLIGITNNPESTLAKACDFCLYLPAFEEACHLGLAPTSSTTAELALCDALAVTLSVYHNFGKNDFAKFHPAGALGKKLILKVGDIMLADNNNAVVYSDATLLQAIVEMSSKSIGMVTIADKDNHLAGIMTDGDLRRLLTAGTDIYAGRVCDVMNRNPIFINQSELAVNALNIMKEKNIVSMPVVDENDNVKGGITINHLINAGILL